MKIDPIILVSCDLLVEKSNLHVPLSLQVFKSFLGIKSNLGLPNSLL